MTSSDSDNYNRPVCIAFKRNHHIGVVWNIHQTAYFIEIKLVKIAKGCSYSNAVSIDNFENFDAELEAAKLRNELILIEVKCSTGARADLGRPTTTSRENKERPYIN